MSDTITLELQRGGRPVLVIGTDPDDQQLLRMLGTEPGTCLVWDASTGHEASGMGRAEGPLSEAVDSSALVVVLDPQHPDAGTAVEQARRRRVPVWVPRQPELGNAAPAATAGTVGEGLGPLAADGILAEGEGQVDLGVSHAPGVGDVSLVGAGPGAADLITVRGLRALCEADVVIHDRLVAASLLEYVPAHCERIFVGKRRSSHPVPQGAINELLLHHARAGRRVVRLKGGDPFIFGRGGEEIEHLMVAGIPFRVIPGITAASGCASYAGIPLTHRDHAQSCAFVTGHRKDGALDVDFRGLVREAQTLVFYMGLHSLRDVQAGLLGEGMDPQTPAALVQQGTTRAQVVVADTIAGLPDKVEAAGIRAPTLLIIGDVVQLRDRLGWFRGHGGAMAWAEGPGEAAD